MHLCIIQNWVIQRQLGEDNFICIIYFQNFIFYKTVSPLLSFFTLKFSPFFNSYLYHFHTGNKEFICLWIYFILNCVTTPAKQGKNVVRHWRRTMTIRRDGLVCLQKKGTSGSCILHKFNCLNTLVKLQGVKQTQ